MLDALTGGSADLVKPAITYRLQVKDRCRGFIGGRRTFEQRVSIVETVEQRVVVIIASAFRTPFHNLRMSMMSIIRVAR
jgi:hypothetical protein